MLEDGAVEVTLSDGNTITVYPLYVTEENAISGGEGVDWSFTLPEGVEEKRVVCILAEIR